MYRNCFVVFKDEKSVASYINDVIQGKQIESKMSNIRSSTNNHSCKILHTYKSNDNSGNTSVNKVHKLNDGMFLMMMTENDLHINNGNNEFNLFLHNLSKQTIIRN